MRTRNVAIGEELFKTLTVFCTVNAVYAATEDFYATFSKRTSQVDCSLTTELYDNAFRLFFVDYVENVFQSQRFKVQFIGDVEVSGNSFRIVVDDDGFVAHFTESPYGVYGAVVKFYALTDTDRTGTKYNNFLFISYSNFVFFFVGGIVVRGCSFEFCSAGIYDFVCRQDVIFFTHCADFESIFAYQFTNYRVSEAHFLSFQEQCRSKFFVFKSFFHFNDIGKFVEEPFIHFGNVIDVVNGHTTTDSFNDNKEAFIVNAFNAVFDFVIAKRFKFRHFKVNQTDFQGTDCFEQGSFKAAFNCHNFAGSFHLGTQSAVSGYEFIERPAREFEYDIVNGRFEASFGSFGYSIFDFVQGVTNSNFTGYFRNGITGCFRCQSGAATYARVNFDYIVAFRMGIQCQLYVTATTYAQFTNDIDRCLTEHTQFSFGKGLSRSNYNGVTGMYANGVNVFHGAYGNAVVSSVTNYFEFDFFPTSNAAFNQALTDGAVAQAFLYDINQFIFIVSNTATSTTQGVSGANNQGIANLTTKFASSHDGFNDDTFRNRLVNFFHCFFEQLTVFATFNSGDLSAKKFYIIFSENAFFFQSQCQVQTNLTAQSSEQGVRTFTFNNIFYEFNIYRFNIYAVCNVYVSHNGCRVGVYQYNFKAFFFQSAASLSTSVVKFCSLTDDDRTGADNENFFYICKFRHD